MERLQRADYIQLHRRKACSTTQRGDRSFTCQSLEVPPDVHPRMTAATL
jgi:uncharacterized Zn-finger protein